MICHAPEYVLRPIFWSVSVVVAPSVAASVSTLSGSIAGSIIFAKRVAGVSEAHVAVPSVLLGILFSSRSTPVVYSMAVAQPSFNDW